LDLISFNGLTNDSFVFSLDTAKAPIEGDKVNIEVQKLEVVVDYAIGRNKAVLFKLSNALDGEDHQNYAIEDVVYYIDIYPYKIEYTAPNGMKFVVEDKDELCVIPIELDRENFKVEIINSVSKGYLDRYNKIQKMLNKSIRVQAFYLFDMKTLTGNTINLSDLAGAYISFGQTRKVVDVYNYDNSGVQEMEYGYQDRIISFVVQENSKNEVLVFENRTYFSIWKIIRIILIILLLLILLIVMVIVIRNIISKRGSRHRELK